jgi:FkbM family methyltransferase
VHAFEVAPPTHALLEAAFRSSPLRSRVELHDSGLSDQPGQQTMYYFPDHDTLTCELPRHDGYAAVPFQAHLTTLDAFCAERGIEAIDYLKIDVEGAEYRVLKGARALLEADRIACIQFEYGAFSVQTRFLLKDYFDLLSDRFAIGKIFPDHVAFGDYDWTAENFRFSNYLCVSKRRSDLAQLLQG